MTSFVEAATAAGELPMLTYYLLLHASHVAEGTPEVTSAARDSSFMAAYLRDFRFLLSKLGDTPAVIHIEPDFWAYAQFAAAAAGTDANGLTAAVSAPSPSDCSGLPDTIAGLGHR